MSKHETPMTRWYWHQVGGTLIEEFCAVRGSRSCGTRLLDLMGQALFSAQLVLPFKPRSVESVALVLRDDAVLRPLFEQYPGMRVVVCPSGFDRLASPGGMSEPAG